MEKIENLKKLIEAKDEYIKLLSDELNELAIWAHGRRFHVHGWKTSRYEEGKKIREKISELERNITE